MTRSWIAPFVVAAGGIVGASLRWLAGASIESDVGTFPWTTMSVNLVGCLLIGIAAARLVRGSLAWDAVVTGGLGGFTTMSTFAQEANDLRDAGNTTTLVLYVALTVGGGVLAASLGYRGEEDVVVDELGSTVGGDLHDPSGID